jgi:hypothetical protein
VGGAAHRDDVTYAVTLVGWEAGSLGDSLAVGRRRSREVANLAQRGEAYLKRARLEVEQRNWLLVSPEKVK